MRFPTSSISFMMVLLLAFAAHGQAPLPVETGVLTAGSGNCSLCHTGAAGVMMEGGQDVSPITLWRSSMMGNAGRDPLWQAKVRSESLHSPAYAELIETKCTRCHTPQGSIEAFHGGAGSYRLDQALADPLALDGVSCTVCHQIEAANLGQPESFSGGYAIGVNHQIRGPYANPLIGPMQVNSGYTPVFGAQMAASELCATCHTLFTPWLDNEGQVGGTFPEQVPYLEWTNSQFPDQGVSCQACHMPETAAAQDISTMPPWHTVQRAPFYKHEFVGGNPWMSGLLRDNAGDLTLTTTPAQLERTRMLGMEQLARAAFLDMEAVADGDSLDLLVRVTNRSGHKLPTGIPLRRMWLRVVATTVQGDTLFQSGAWDAGGNTPAPSGAWEPHHQVIRDPARTQIWEGVMGDADEAPTWILLRASHFLKDNRIPPAGFRSDAPGYSNMAVVGVPGTDSDFNLLGGEEGSGSDAVHYRFPLSTDSLHVEVDLVYQSVPPGLQASFTGQDSPEIARWLELSSEADFAPLPVAHATWSGAGRPAATRVEATVQGGQVVLNWEAVPGAAAYQVWRFEGPWPGLNPMAAGTLVAETTGFSLVLANQGEQGFYQVIVLR
jgi:hypothetical protein